MTDDIKDCFRDLDLNGNESLDEVKAAYRELAQIWHPDRFQHDLKLQQRGNEKLKNINAAYETLKEYFANGGHSQQQAAREQAAREQSSREVYLYMTCFRCQGSITFPTAKAGEYSTCPHCGGAITLSVGIKTEYRQNPRPKPVYSQPERPRPNTGDKDNQSNELSDESNGTWWKWVLCLGATLTGTWLVCHYAWNFYIVGLPVIALWEACFPKFRKWNQFNRKDKDAYGLSKPASRRAHIVMWVLIVFFISVTIYFLFW